MLTKLFKIITKNNSKGVVNFEVAETIPEFLDENWQDEFDCEIEAYQETGRGEAESQVIWELINKAKHDEGEISTDQQVDLFEKLAEYYELSTN